jgi:hypothetical protein
MHDLCYKMHILSFPGSGDIEALMEEKTCSAKFLGSESNTEDPTQRQHMGTVLLCSIALPTIFPSKAKFISF